MEEEILANTLCASKMDSLGLPTDLESFTKRYKASTQTVHDHLYYCYVHVANVIHELPAVIQGPFERPPWAAGATHSSLCCDYCY